MLLYDLVDYDLTIVCVYRTNLISTNEFIHSFEVLLNKISEIDRECVIVGDFNINCLGNPNVDVIKLTDLISVHGMCNLVDFPTRITASTSTSLDHLYSNLADGTVTVDPVVTNISDHLAIKGEIIRARTNSRQSYSFVRKFSNSNKSNFVASIDSVDWNELICNKNRASSDMLDTIINVIKNKYEICFPLKKTCKKHLTHPG